MAMTIKFNFKSKSAQILLHSLVWLFFLNFPFLFFNDDISLIRLTEHFFRSLLLIVLFYTNSLILIPKFLTKNKIGIYILSILTSIILYIILCVLSDYLNHVIFSIPRCHPLYFIIPKSFFAALFILGLSTSFKVTIEWFNSERQKKELETEKLASELAFLKSQINPHFLFNTLSSLRALTSEENVKAKEIITKISEFLRYTLITSGNNEVPLKNEIEVVKNYLDIEKVRFEEELLVEFDIDPAAEMCLIPIFLIHPLVENAIKHGMQTSPIPLKIFITAKMIDNILYLCVTNTGSWINRTEKNSTGKGLENIKKRLEIFSPTHHNFEVIKNAETVEVKLSLKRRIDKF